MKKLVHLILIMGLLSCTDGMKDIAIDEGYDFYPIEIGQERIYQVEEINLDALGSDTSQYFLREVITDTLRSGEDVVRYLINRYKSSDTTNWNLDSIWSVHQMDNFMIVTENNVPIVKLAFPVRQGRVWNGNAYNTKSEVIFYYESVNSLSVEGFNSTNLIRVVLEDIPRNLVDQDEKSEVYALGVGLVEKKYTTLQFCTLNCSGSEVIESGRILQQNLISYEF